MSTPVADLILTHSQYDFYKATWQTIKDLREGFTTLYAKKERYIPIRIGETEDVYKNRLSALAYTNILNENCHRLVSILTSSPVSLEYTDPLWDALLNRMDGESLTHTGFIARVYADLLYYGRLIVAIDNPAIANVSRSRLEYVTKQAYPRATFLHALEVINWGSGWTMTQQVNEQNVPLQARKMLATWKLWTEESITTWSAEVAIDSDANVVSVKVGDKWYDPTDRKRALLDGTTLYHGWGALPVIHRTIPDEQWVGGALSSKALQHFVIESSLTWAGRYAGVIQRLFKPTPPTVNDNPAFYLEQPDYSELKSDNAHVLIGDDFQFRETQGTAISSLLSLLDTIKKDAKDTVNITFASGAPVQQSGIAKKVDMLLLQNALSSYGYIATEVDEQVLSIIARGLGVEPPTVKNNQNYSLEDASAMLDVVDRIEPHLAHLAPEVVEELYKKLQYLLLPDAPREVQQAIEETTPSVESQQQTQSNENHSQSPGGSEAGVD